MRSIILASLMLTLAACGADVATATATTAKLQAEQAKQAKETAAQLTQKLDTNLKAGEQRSAESTDEKR
jgi:hypothetical protein